MVQKRIASPKSRLRTAAAVQREVDKVLAATDAKRWIEASVTTTEEHAFKQTRPGRPSKDTPFQRIVTDVPVLTWKVRADAVEYDARTDGLFPLLTNDRKLSMAEALKAYKHQPALEKRHEQLKTVYEVMPVLLKSPSRIEGFLFLYFVVLLVQALIERELRLKMKAAGIQSLPLYFEARPCKSPTADRVFSLFSDIRAHALVSDDGRRLQHFRDRLSETQCQILDLLGIPKREYFELPEARARN